ncbi:MAG TPA: hypothetical protein VHE30_15185 [Polyangiaceae bacterium]|nr:hypothetical protein [Polyangiaceae bacterium]
MTTPDDEPTEEELREAEALARALERGHAPPGTPEDALGAAAFLRFTKDGGSLSAEDSERILEDALRNARLPVRTPWRFRLFGVLGLAGAAAAVLLIVARQAPSGELPVPPRALLEAQVDVASGKVASLDALGAETAAYRRAVFASLEGRYGR